MSKVRASASSKLVQAARAYGEALKRQHRASAAMHRARFSATASLRERDHDAACVALDQAEHDLLVTAAMLSGFSRRNARRSV
ncbi:MAG TPA: hypothetical protein VLE97_10615 [Gaiellaceae bacterium]|nr:hypothetical protein [Gaiellaceae bacterium]